MEIIFYVEKNLRRISIVGGSSELSKSFSLTKIMEENSHIIIEFEEDPN